MFSSFKSPIPQNICVFGANEFAVSVAAVIAFKCPNLRVCVVDFDPDRVSGWEEKGEKRCHLDLEKLLERCKNLTFERNMREGIIAGDIILLMTDSSSSATDAKVFEEAARRIAEVTENNKIVVEKSLNVPLRTCKTLKLALDANKLKNANFQVLAMPEFFTGESPVSYLLKPEFVFIGHEESLKGKSAASTLADVYTRWVPGDNIKTMNWTSAELSKLAINAMWAAKTISFGAVSAICEQSGKNINDIVRVLRKMRLGNQYLEPSLGNMNQYRDTANLTWLFEKFGFAEMADYWQEIIKQYDWQEIRFEKKIFSAFFNTLNKKKLAIFGVSMEGSSNITSESPAIRLSARMLEEGGELSLYEPRVKLERERVVEALKECGVEEGVEDRVTLFEDPHKAAEKVHGIILCSDWKELKGLDFATIYRDMMKPAHIFDRRNVLDHEFLMKMGFKVQAVGRAS